MNKYGWLFFSLMIAILTTIIAGELEGFAVSQEISNTTPEVLNVSLDSVQGFFSTYWRLLSFQVTGVPAFLSLFFMMLNIIIAFIFVEGVLIPAVNALPL